MAINLFHLKVPSSDGYHQTEIWRCQAFFSGDCLIFYKLVFLSRAKWIKSHFERSVVHESNFTLTLASVFPALDL
ncbi:MAG: hypothetical protein P8165_18125, partial [Deltaproteobacteria bacterium]